jgi:hypothetical protein
MTPQYITPALEAYQYRRNTKLVTAWSALAIALVILSGVAIGCYGL